MDANERRPQACYSPATKIPQHIEADIEVRIADGVAVMDDVLGRRDIGFARGEADPKDRLLRVALKKLLDDPVGLVRR